ncbi:MAG TPA: biopolymer transporter ExbD [Chthoniobacteraceae bacterium]|nr:biopolymer transporter ExbD [Chthoniobacteraceae bacterium]
MRRYSQRQNLGTLAELNVTPLLDLAFVLLIIFMITTPLMEKNEPLILPTSNAANGAIGPEDQMNISITRDGAIALNKEAVSLDQLESQLLALKESHPRIAVNIRADKEVTVQKFTEVSDIVRKAGITYVTMGTNSGSGQ